MEFQQQERAKSDRMRRQLLISQEKVPATIKFKPPTLVFPPPKNIAPQESNYSSFSSRNQGPSYLSFFFRMNPFSLSKQPLLIWRKEKEPLLIWKKENFHPFFFIIFLSDLRYQRRRRCCSLCRQSQRCCTFC